MSRSITPAPTPPQTITVSSAAGFNAGDLVYFNGSTGDYGTPPLSVAGATVSVPVTGPAAILGGITGATGVNVGIYGGCATTSFTAILTNNNIVQVYIDANAGVPVFRIVDTAGTVVVAPTAISVTFTQGANPNIAVAALTGGGFAVAWINNSGGTVNVPCYAVYSNTGTVVTAATQDTTSGATTSEAFPIRLKAAPGGGFLISFYGTSTATAYARGYSATGVAAFAWVSLTGLGVSQQHGFAVRSDGSFLVVGANTATTAFLYAIWSSTGTVIVSPTSFTTTFGGSVNASCDATCLTDGTTFVIAYSAFIAANTVAFRFLPTGNTLGAEFYIPPANYPGSSGSAGTYVVDITALSSNRFVIFGNVAGVPQGIWYAIFNSSGVCLSGTVAGTASTAALPKYFAQAIFNTSSAHVSCIEAPAGFITLYYVNPSAAKAYGYNSSAIDLSTYNPVKVIPTTQNIGSVTSTPIAYAPSGSSPLGAAYSITPGPYAPVSVFGTVVKNPEIVNPINTVGSIATTTLIDGRVLVAYIDASTYNVYVAVYSIAGVFTQTLTIGTDGLGSPQSFSKMSISALTSGKFVIAYASTSTTYTVKLYSSTFTQIGSTYTVSIPGNVSSEYNASVSGLTDDRYVVVYSGTSNYPTYRVYDGTNTQLVAATVINSGVDMKSMAVSGMSNGGFAVSGRLTTNVQQMATWTNTSGNTFTQILAWVSITGAANPSPNTRVVANTAGAAFCAFPGSSTTVTLYRISPSTYGGSSVSSGTLTSIDGVSAGVTGYGTPVLSGQVSGATVIYCPTGSVILSSTLFKPYVVSAFSQNSMTPSYGYNVGFAYIDINSKANYSIICGLNGVDYATLTSTDPSTPINIYPGTTSASPAIQNTVFTGVALQTVPAGGAGLVQVSGTAQLGSTYPSTTTYRAFDHQGQGVPGVKGTITGRAITLQGT